MRAWAQGLWHGRSVDTGRNGLQAFYRSCLLAVDIVVVVVVVFVRSTDGLDHT